MSEFIRYTRPSANFHSGFVGVIRVSNKLILLRHGQSGWNSEDRLSGWTDVDLSAKGRAEAITAGEVLKQAGVQLDVAHTSMLKRSIRTLWSVLDVLDQMWVPVHKTWRLNERHYGALQGIDREEVVAKYGLESVETWRKEYHAVPPPIAENSPAHPRHDRRYEGVLAHQFPLSESIANTWTRVEHYWAEKVTPDLLEHKTVVIVSHGNVLRAIYKHLNGLTDEEFARYFFINATPVVLELNDALKVVKQEVLVNSVNRD